MTSWPWRLAKQDCVYVHISSFTWGYASYLKFPVSWDNSGLRSTAHGAIYSTWGITEKCYVANHPFLCIPPGLQTKRWPGPVFPLRDLRFLQPTMGWLDINRHPTLSIVWLKLSFIAAILKGYSFRKKSFPFFYQLPVYWFTSLPKEEGRIRLLLQIWLLISMALPRNESWSQRSKQMSHGLFQQPNFERSHVGYTQYHWKLASPTVDLTCMVSSVPGWLQVNSIIVVLLIKKRDPT